MSEPSLKEMQDQLSEAAETLALDTELVFKPMFGGVCAYIQSRVFASLSNVGLALKLSPADQTELLKTEGAKRLQYEPDAPESKQYIVVPASIRTQNEEFAPWVKRSADFVLAQPAPKPRKRV